MSIIFEDGIYKGLSTDEKPSGERFRKATFRETDAGDYYYNLTGYQWELQIGPTDLENEVATQKADTAKIQTDFSQLQVEVGKDAFRKRVLNENNFIKNPITVNGWDVVGGSVLSTDTVNTIDGYNGLKSSQQVGTNDCGLKWPFLLPVSQGSVVHANFFHSVKKPSPIYVYLAEFDSNKALSAWTHLEPLPNSTPTPTECDYEVTITSATTAYVKFYVQAVSTWAAGLDPQEITIWKPIVTLGTGKKPIDSSVTTEKAAVTDIVVPPVVYTVANDIDTSRQNSACLYIDHMLKPADVDSSTCFTATGTDKLPVVSDMAYDASNNLVINGGNNVSSVTKTVSIKSNGFVYDDKTFTHRSTKASVGKSNLIATLFIGDSNLHGVGAGAFDVTGVGFPAFVYVREMFEKDKVDGGNNANEYNFRSIGVSSKYTLPFNYKTVTSSIKVSAQGNAGWSLADIMHYATHRDPSQATYDLLGLGNGTHTDYTGSLSQKYAMALANETNATATPDNPFFDNSKSGDNKFSIAKFLERYRTCDDSGNKLALGAPTLGTKITQQSQIDEMDVFTPTHIFIMHGRNDNAFNTQNAFTTNMQRFITAAKAELPNVKILIGITPDLNTTYFPERYPYIPGTIKRTDGTTWRSWASNIITNFGNMEANKVFLVPMYFVQPTAEGATLQNISEPGGTPIYRPVAPQFGSHLGAGAQKAVAYQLYSALKYTASLS